MVRLQDRPVVVKGMRPPFYPIPTTLHVTVSVGKICHEMGFPFYLLLFPHHLRSGPKESFYYRTECAAPSVVSLWWRLISVFDVY